MQNVDGLLRGRVFVVVGHGEPCLWRMTGAWRRMAKEADRQPVAEEEGFENVLGGGPARRVGFESAGGGRRRVGRGPGVVGPGVKPPKVQEICILKSAFWRSRPTIYSLREHCPLYVYESFGNAS